MIEFMLFLFFLPFILIFAYIGLIVIMQVILSPITLLIFLLAWLHETLTTTGKKITDNNE